MNTADTGLHLENFEVFPKHVGVWEGNWIRLDADSQEIERFRGVVTKKIVNNQWIQTNTYYYTDGRSVTQFVGLVAGKGRVRIESSEPPFSISIPDRDSYLALGSATIDTIPLMAHSCVGHNTKTAITTQ